MPKIVHESTQTKKTRLFKFVKEHRQLYVFIAPAILLLFIFNYLPMYGILIAFKDFRPHLGIQMSPYVGFRHFIRFFNMPMFRTVMVNTLNISIYSLIAGFPLPIILALALNSTKALRFKKIVQTVTYAPHFISTVVIVGMLKIFLSPSTGVVRNILFPLGLIENYLNVLMNANSFYHLFVWSGVWATIGWNSIIYLGALSSVDPCLHEAAIVDGANKFQRAIHVDIPAILPTIIIILILNVGMLMNVGFEKAFLLQNPFNLSRSEILATYIYKIGIREGQYGLSAAMGLCNSLINFVLLISVNWISKKVGKQSLW